ncbi:MAG: carboxy terminal-processing peptidase [Pseudomonadales bacterium]|nr:carboxy terminal-processing peptidase [Pseudomonadales bacterium]
MPSPAVRFARVMLLPAVLLTGAASAITLDTVEVTPLEPLEVHPRTSVNVVEQLARHHYVRRGIDDDLSSTVFDRYLEMLDPQRSYFLADDVRAFEKYRYALDDALRRGDLEPAFEMFNRYHAILVDRLEHVVTLLNAGIDDWDFDADETLQTDRSDAPWLESAAARDDLWRRRLKANALAMRLNDKDMDEITEVLLKRYRNRLHRATQTNAEDAFQVYMNAVATSYDPHTQYFSPRTSENFNINMSLSLEGIGAVLRTEDEYTTVVRLVPAGPADKSELLGPEDRIVSVAQGDEGEWVDVVGWRLDDVVDLIRGPAGSTVRLEIVPDGQDATGKSQRIALVREAVKLEEQSAQSRVIEIERNGTSHRVGVIDIPTFYIDFKALQQGDPEYKSTTRDVRRLIEELEAEGIDGLVIDLRNNGGGSLQEANSLTGLFIKAGPTVQIRSASGRVDLFNDEDGEVAWDGPLAVLVNRLSASASEIFAGAIQDYQRGLIIGGQTFGKGTVQTLIPLNRGQLKMTQAKFYRVSGQSTQHQGIIPDIEYPELYDHEEIGESTLDDALPWDVIRPTRFRRAEPLAPLLSMLEHRHRARIEDDPEFVYIERLLERTRERNARSEISLSEARRRSEQEEEEAWRLELENMRRVARGEAPISDLDELDEDEADPTVAAGNADIQVPGAVEDELDAAGDTEETVASEEDEADDDEADALLVESGHILLDYITLARSVADLDAPATEGAATN